MKRTTCLPDRRGLEFHHSQFVFRYAMASMTAVMLILLLPTIGLAREAQRPSTGSLAAPLTTDFKPDDSHLEPTNGRYIVILKETTSDVRQVARTQVDQREGDLGFVYSSGIKGYSVRGLSPTDVRSLRANPLVKYVAPDRKVKAQSQTTPTGIKRIFDTENPTADIDETDDARVNADVAVIDTGIDYQHPDLNVVARTDCTISESGCVDGAGTDENGHGTHVAGIIGALDNNLGTVGVAPGARLWAVKVLDQNGEGYESWILAGINWVTAHASDIEVANMSLAGEGRSRPWEEAIEESLDAGVVYTVAAGNESENVSNVTPANIHGVITVSALADSDGKPGGTGSECIKGYGKDDTLATFSNWGQGVDIAAPGMCIYSTWKNGGYAYDSGTSMAAPHVAGAAALLASKENPNSRAQVESIRNALVQGGRFEWDDTSGDRQVEPLLYLGAAKATGLTAATAGYSQTSSSGAVLYGTVTGESGSTYQFEYGSTSSYGHVAPSQAAQLPSGSEPQSVEQAIGGLPLEGTYHYRLVVHSGGSSVYGPDHSLSLSTATIASVTRTLPAPDSEKVRDVSCAQASSCMAIGTFTEGEKYPGAFVYRLAGGSWQQQILPTPPGTGQAEGWGVSCVSAANCVAVGAYVNSENEWRPMAVRWDGSEWHPEAVPRPVGAEEGFLEDVSCMSSGECVAVGSVFDPSENAWVNYSARWPSANGWSVISTPVSSYDSSLFTIAELEDVSCVSNSFCEAVGYSHILRATPLYIGNAPELMRWDGTKWNVQQPAEEASKRRGVSCTSPTFCMTVGAYPYTEIWNGTKWTEHDFPEQAESKLGFLNSVSCIAENFCEAAGSWTGRRVASLTEKWTGSQWREQASPTVSEDDDPLSSVSCVASGPCTEVGQAQQFARIESKPDLRPTVSTHDYGIGQNEGYVVLFGSANPNGLKTTYHFEWGTQAEFEAGKYGHVTPVPDANIGSGESTVEFTQQPSGMKGLTTYHVRLVAENQEGRVSSPDYFFTTPDWRPLLNRVRQRGVGRTTAKLGAFIDPKSHATTYHFEWGTQAEFEEGKYGHVLPVPDASIGSGYGLVDVSKVVEGLEQRKTYHFRLVAESEEGKSVSEDHTFTTSTSGFVAGGYPAVVQGSVAGYGQILSFGGGIVFNCPGSPLLAAEVSGPTELISTTVDEGTCESTGLGAESATLKTNGCHWVFHPGGETSAGVFRGSMDLGPSGCGAMVLESKNCSRIYPPQEDAEVTFEQKGSGTTATVKVVAQSELQYTVEGSPTRCGTPGWSAYQAGWELAAVKGGVHVGLRIDGLLKTKPTATIATPDSITPKSAVLKGIINPNLLTSTYQFEYGTTTAYGSKVPTSPASVGSGEASVEVSQALEGLKPHTIYHYRLNASNAEGSSFSEDRTFTTPGLHVTRLESDSYPVTISGQQESSNKQLMTLEGSRKFSCEKANLSTSSINALSEPRFKPEYSGCTAEILGNVMPATILTNSCEYSMAIANTASPYTASLGVACAKEGEGIELKAYQTAEKQSKGEVYCAYKIAAQTGLKGIGLSNFGTGSERGVSAKFESVSVPYTKTSGTITSCGAASSTAPYSGTTTMRGF